MYFQPGGVRQSAMVLDRFMAMVKLFEYGEGHGVTTHVFHILIVGPDMVRPEDIEAVIHVIHVDHELSVLVPCGSILKRYSRALPNR